MFQLLFPRFSYTVTITIKDVSISATASKKKDAKNLAYRNMAIRLEHMSEFSIWNSDLCNCKKGKCQFSKWLIPNLRMGEVLMKLKPQPGTDLLELKKMTRRMRDRWRTKLEEHLYFLGL